MAKELILAVKADILPRVEELLLQVDVRSNVWKTVKLLHFAESYAVAKTLLKHGAPIEAACGLFQTRPLHQAARNGNKGVVKALLEFYAKINAIDHNSKNALHHAAENGRTEVVRLLLSNPNTQIDAKDKKGNTALHMATHGKHLKVIDLLIKGGVNTKLDNNKGLRPLLYAMTLDHVSCMKRLIGKGRDF